MGFLTFHRNTEWHDDKTILMAISKDHPKSVSVWLGLGVLEVENNNCREAIKYFKKALEMGSPREYILSKLDSCKPNSL